MNNLQTNYWSLDVAKLFCALTIIAAHFASEWGSFPTLIDYSFSIYVIAVPFFFCCSGFLFFSKMREFNCKEKKKAYFVRYQKRIWIMYACWTAVYFPFVVFAWIQKGTFGWQQFFKWLHMALVIQTYATIWFLPALAIGIAITYYLILKLKKKTIFMLACVLYLMGTLGYTYSFIVEGTPLDALYDWYLIIFKTTRNALFNAMPFIFMGYIIANKEIKLDKQSLYKYSILSCFALFLIVIEGFTLKMNFFVTGMDFCFFIVPFIYLFVMSLLNLELKEHPAWIWCRQYSLLIFVSQRLFLSALPSVFPSIFELLYENSYVGLLAVITLTVVFSAVLRRLSETFIVLKKMM